MKTMETATLVFLPASLVAVSCRCYFLLKIYLIDTETFTVNFQYGGIQLGRE